MLGAVASAAPRRTGNGPDGACGPEPEPGEPPPHVLRRQGTDPPPVGETHGTAPRPARPGAPRRCSRGGGRRGHRSSTRAPVPPRHGASRARACRARVAGPPCRPSEWPTTRACSTSSAVERGTDVERHATQRGEPWSTTPYGPRPATRRRGPASSCTENPSRPSPTSRDHGGRRDDPVVHGQVPQLMGPQRAAQHETVQQHHRGPLAALATWMTPRRRCRPRARCIVGHGEALRHDLVRRGVGPPTSRCWVAHPAATAAPVPATTPAPAGSCTAAACHSWSSLARRRPRTAHARADAAEHLVLDGVEGRAQSVAVSDRRPVRHGAPRRRRPKPLHRVRSPPRSGPS